MILVVHTMDPMAGKNSRSPQEKSLFPSFPRSRQGKWKTGIFPCQLTGNYFHGFSGVFSWVHQSRESVGFFSLFFHREFFSPCFSGFFSWAHQCLVFFKFFSLFYITVDNPGESCDVLRVGSNDE